ncbi:sensor histidine kinase [Acidihalobacter ferrooxydans]|uniref:histidine kinase n=1 Tax=Acidihalobacter ferrooxydans TaxID=1765967 RepID=A0A1P8UGR6_9GAMM|nr:ATP-binding protein [Acidihalobacter ferrooxydans]APZ43000.1 hypothetical protein BW247_07765 [Acidihalobacter ferrooxydans]
MEQKPAKPLTAGTEDSIEARERALAEAFDAFNRLSADLARSYRELEQRVEQLSEELAAARSERLIQLAEKERLANRLSQLLEALPGAVVVTDARNIVREANPAALEFFGLPLLGTSWNAVMQSHFAEGDADSGEVKLIDGRRLSLTRRSLAPEPGQIWLLQDVTETRALQTQLDRHQRLAAMGEMVAGLAHQIRTPLASVLLYLSHLEQKKLEPEPRERILGRIRGRVLYLENMIGDMLQFARGGEAERAQCALATLIAEFEDMLAVPLRDAGATLVIAWADPALRQATVACQRSALVGAMLNLATNAISAGGPGVALRLGIAMPTPQSLRLSLEDDGPGIDPAIAERIFEPFFTTSTQGTGLGLPVVRAVMDAHAGEVRVEPARHLTGARFTLELPTAPES